MSEHRGREVSKLKGPELYLDLFTGSTWISRDCNLWQLIRCCQDSDATEGFETLLEFTER